MKPTQIKSVAYEPKAYTKKELRQLYGIPETTFKRWLRAIPETENTGRKNWLTPDQVAAIFKKYGVPGVKVIDFNNSITANNSQ